MQSYNLFNEKRTAQAAAFLLHKAGGRLPVIKLMKLLYLAERESYRLFGEPISGDRLVSMRHGPVLSATLDLMSGFIPGSPDGWEAWIEDRAGHDVALRDPSMIRSPGQDLLELSDGDLEILEDVWSQYGHMARFDLVDLTHNGACPEWEDPNGSSRPIPMARLFKALGYPQDAIHAALEHLKDQNSLRASLGSA